MYNDCAEILYSITIIRSSAYNMVTKILHILKKQTTLLHIREFFVATNLVIFFKKKSSLQILFCKYIFVNIFQEKISIEINVQKTNVSKKIFGEKEFISLTIRPSNYSSTTLRNKIIVQKKFPPNISFHKYVHIY